MKVDITSVWHYLDSPLNDKQYDACLEWETAQAFGTTPDHPAYFAVITGKVRYDPRVSAGAKLLYGEISALTNMEGFCFAGNAYFATLYHVNSRKIQLWIEELKRCNHVKVEVDKKSGNKRKIYLVDPLTPVAALPHAGGGVRVASPSPSTPTPTPRGNNTSNGGRFSKPSAEECSTYCRELKIPVGEAEDFRDYYDSCGWTVGKNKPMKDWKACMRRWARGWHKKNPYDPNNPPSY